MQHRFTKHHRSVRAPPVLIVSLNRSEGLGAHGQPVTLLHAVEATENVDFAGASYRMKSVICHLGPSPNSGHYITVARHGETWWLFDDKIIIPAMGAQISTQSSYGQWGQMQSYILFYERYS